MKKAKLAVIGSSSMDLVVRSQQRPGPGETVLGESFTTVPGGKGANQAVAAARLGADVTMIGCVGEDSYGDEVLQNFKKNGVQTNHVKRISKAETGTAHIILAEGDNSIVVVKGANDYVTPAYVEEKASFLRTCDLILIQQEIPEESVSYVADLSSEWGIPLLLNPAPARPLQKNVVEQAAYLTPNEHEAAVLFGGLSLTDAVKQFPNKVMVTEGAAGVRYHDGEAEVMIPSFPVSVVDTTGAGDTFNAAFGVALAEGKCMEDSLRFANRAASLSVTGFGAQGGMPSRAEVERKLHS